MEAIIQKFIEDIQHLSVAELRALCAELKRENEDLQSIISVYRESDTNIARDYQAAQDKIADLERKLKALQKSYDYIAAQNDLLTRHRFGSHNEKLDNLCSPTDDLIDPLSVPQTVYISTDVQREEKRTDSNLRYGRGTSHLYDRSELLCALQ